MAALDWVSDVAHSEWVDDDILSTCNDLPAYCSVLETRLSNHVFAVGQDCFSLLRQMGLMVELTLSSIREPRVHTANSATKY